MYGIKAIEVRGRLDRLFERFSDESKSDHESLVELWAIVSDVNYGWQIKKKK